MTPTTTDRPSTRPMWLTVALVAVLVAALGAGGCAPPNAIEIQTTAEFNKALENKKPVLMMFWKFGCASCMLLEGGFEKLATEYKGRIYAGRVMIMNLMFISPFPELQQKYEIGFVPVVILFQDGQEKQRWTVDYSMEKYEKALTALVGPPDRPGATTQPATQPTSQPESQPAETGNEPDELTALLQAATRAAASQPASQPATQPASQPATQPATQPAKAK